MSVTYTYDGQQNLWRWAVHEGGIDGPVVRSGVTFDLESAFEQTREPATVDAQRAECISNTRSAP